MAQVTADPSVVEQYVIGGTLVTVHHDPDVADDPYAVVLGEGKAAETLPRRQPDIQAAFVYALEMVERRGM